MSTIGLSAVGIETSARRVHGKFSYQVNARVPLIVAQPGVLPSGLRIDWPVGLVDVPPTLLEFAGVPTPPQFEGASLTGLIRGATAARGPEHVVMTSGYRPRRPQLPVREGKWQLIHVQARMDRRAMTGSRFELYDLAADPDELRNLAPAHPDLVERLNAVLHRWHGDGFASRGGDHDPAQDGALAETEHGGFGSDLKVPQQRGGVAAQASLDAVPVPLRQAEEPEPPLAVGELPEDDAAGGQESVGVRGAFGGEEDFRPRDRTRFVVQHEAVEHYGPERGPVKCEHACNHLGVPPSPDLVRTLGLEG